MSHPLFVLGTAGEALGLVFIVWRIAIKLKGASR